MEKFLIILCSVFFLVHCDSNETVTNATEVIVESEPQALLDISKIKNSTKDAADRIIKLITSSKEIETGTTERPIEFTSHPLFNSFYNLGPDNIFGLHKTPEAPKVRTSGERLCRCQSEYSIPSFSSSFIPSSEYSFNSRDIPTFEVIRPSTEFTFSNTVESPFTDRDIINQYPALEFGDLWKYQGSTARSIDKK